MLTVPLNPGLPPEVSFCLAHDWPVLWLVTDGPDGKIPPRNCARCRDVVRETHDPEVCTCLTCHSFYAASRDPSRVAAALGSLVAAGKLPAPAVRTGAAGRLVVLDAEAHARPGEPSGLEVLDRWEEVVGGWSLPGTLAARSVSGGLHLYYRTPPGWETTSGRVLPGLDVKSGYGYVGCPGGDGRRSWVDPEVPVADAPAALLDWLAAGRRSGTSRGGAGRSGPPAGYDYAEFLRTRCPAGHRDFFTNDLLFRHRRRGYNLEQLTDLAWEHWNRYAQPPDAEYEMPWRHVVYKVRRVFGEVAPEDRPSPALRRWAAATSGTVGRVTLAGGDR